MKHNVNFGTGTIDQEEDLKGILESDVFVVLLTEHSVKEAKIQAQWYYALELNKPFIAILLDGTEVPPDFPAPNDIQYIKSNSDNMEFVASELERLLDK